MGRIRARRGICRWRRTLIPNGPIASYLRELRRKLPYPAPRLIVETREHLLDSAAMFATDHGPGDAEQRAVERYGPVDDVVGAVKKEGSPMMSPGVLRWILPLAALLTLPSAIFLFTNGIEHLAGSDGSQGVFGASLDKWQTPVTALLVLGPLVALALVVLASTRIDFVRSSGGLNATIDIKLTRRAMFASIAIALIVAAIVVYGITENLDMPGGVFGGDWSCEVRGATNRMTCVEL